MPDDTADIIAAICWSIRERFVFVSFLSYCAPRLCELARRTALTSAAVSRRVTTTTRFDYCACLHFAAALMRTAGHRAGFMMKMAWGADAII